MASDRFSYNTLIEQLRRQKITVEQYWRDKAESDQVAFEVMYKNSVLGRNKI